MQLAEAIALSKKNEELLQQLINQTNAQSLPLCIRHLTALKKLDMQHLVGILLSVPSLQKDTLIDLAADALCNADIISDRFQAEQKAADALEQCKTTDVSCQDVLTDLPAEVLKELLSMCCCCCPVCKTVNPDLYQANLQRQSDELELIRYLIAFPERCEQLTSTFSLDILFRSRIDTGADVGNCIMPSVLQAVQSHTPPTDPTISRYYQLLSDASNQNPISMEQVEHLLDYSGKTDIMTYPQLPAKLLNLQPLLITNTDHATRIIKEIQASRIMPVESILLDGHLTLVIFRLANHQFYQVSPKVVSLFLPMFSNRAIKKYALAPQALVASLRIWQKSHLFSRETIFPIKNITPLVDQEGKITNDYNMLVNISFGISFADFYMLLLKNVSNSHIKITSSVLPSDWLLKAWYYYIPDAEGMVTASNSLRLLENPTEDAKNQVLVHGARPIVIHFLSGQPVSDCCKAFLSLAEKSGIQKWNCLALVQLLDDGFSFVCVPDSFDYLFDLLHSWAEKAVVLANRQDVEIQAGCC